MSLYLIKSKVILIYRRLTGLFAIAVVCILFLMAGLASTSYAEASVGTASDVNSPAGGTGSKSRADVNDANGPTVLFDYNNQTAKWNSTSSFLYFVPLVSPTLVDVETIADNEQKVRTVSYERKVTSKSFYVSCEFEMLGEGFYKNTFDVAEIIAICLSETKTGETLTNALDYIKFDGAGLGRIEVRGTIKGDVRTINEVDVHFNARGRKSPVTIGLYTIDPKDGLYKYENKYNEIIARVATLTFKKSEGEPRMGVKLVSVNKATHPSGYLGRIKGLIANFFINPVKVSKLGNDTMLNFGLALLDKQPSFTFPKANNIRSTKTVAVKNNP
jgi:hypothetical protein